MRIIPQNFSFWLIHLCACCFSSLSTLRLLLLFSRQKLGFVEEWANEYDEGLRIDAEDPGTFLPVTVQTITESKQL